MGKRRGRAKSKNMYKGPVAKDNGAGGRGGRRTECGRWGWVRHGRVKGGNGDNCK